VLPENCLCILQFGFQLAHTLLQNLGASRLSERAARERKRKRERKTATERARKRGRGRVFTRAVIHSTTHRRCGLLDPALEVPLQAVSWKCLCKRSARRAPRLVRVSIWRESGGRGEQPCGCVCVRACCACVRARAHAGAVAGEQSATKPASRVATLGRACRRGC